MQIHTLPPTDTNAQVDVTFPIIIVCIPRYKAIPTIAQFGSRISASAGKSGNVEFVIVREKLGGNGPIMCNAMMSYDIEVDIVPMMV